MKKLFRIVMLTIVSTLIVTMSAYASGTGLVTENIGVSTEIPEYYGEAEDSYGDITPFGLAKPPKSKVVNLNKGQMDFAGVASGSTLYTNNNFKGKEKVSITVKNNRDKKLTVKVFKNGKIFSIAKKTVDGNVQLVTSVSGLDADEPYYLSFIAPSNFAGHVK
jgi:hypothetical protein